MALHFFQCFKPWHYYLPILDYSFVEMTEDYSFVEVTEEEFFNHVGTDRNIVPSYYNKRLHRETFLLGNSAVGYRERGM